MNRPYTLKPHPSTPSTTNNRTMQNPKLTASPTNSTLTPLSQAHRSIDTAHPPLTTSSHNYSIEPSSTPIPSLT